MTCSLLRVNLNKGIEINSSEYNMAFNLIVLLLLKHNAETSLQLLYDTDENLLMRFTQKVFLLIIYLLCSKDMFLLHSFI